MPTWFSALIPVVTGTLGLTAGLASPFITGGVGRRTSRRSDQRERCDEILNMFKDVNVVRTLRDSSNGTRRMLILASVRLRDRAAREACMEMVEQSSRPDATDDEILDAWITMVKEVARVHRAAS